jgi:hypothetical protein
MVLPHKVHAGNEVCIQEGKIAATDASVTWNSKRDGPTYIVFHIRSGLDQLQLKFSNHRFNGKDQNLLVCHGTEDQAD